MRLAGLVFAALLVLAGPAFALDARDRTFAPGRVGAIVIGKTDPADLAKIYGAANVKYQKIGYEGGETPGAHVFPESPNFLEIMFTEDGKKIDTVIIGGKNWVSRSGLRIGVRVAQLERMNGGPFNFQGFGADEGGRISAGAPPLAPYSIYIGETSEADRKALLKYFHHEKVFSSRHPGMRNSQFAVRSIYVQAPPPKED